MPKANTPLTLLGDISAEQFLAEYWQKKPLLIRQAIPDFSCPVDPDELAGLAMEDEVESRLILENGSQGPWELKRGPFSETDFQALPESHWTLLIQQLDAWSPEINALKQQFQFIPNWRIDDIMASYAPVGGSVGPHFDHYDVFLLQAHGERHWRVGQTCSNNEQTLSHTPLSILETFDEEGGWVLEPGDMLYLPPKLAHFGIANNDCITLSIGFRAPTHDQMLSHFADHLLEHIPPKTFYSDPDLKSQGHCGEITPDTLSKVKSILSNYLQNEEQLAHWFGAYITEAKNEQIISSLDEPIDTMNLVEMQDFIESIADDYILTNEGSRFAYTEHDSGIAFFVDGKRYQTNKEYLLPIQTLCELGAIPANELLDCKNNAQFAALIIDLINQGSLYCDHNDP